MNIKNKISQLVFCLSLLSFLNCLGSGKNAINFNEPEVMYTQQEFFAYSINSIGMWKEIVNKLENEFANLKDDTIALYKLSRSQYGLLTACIGNQDEATFNTYINNFDENIKQLTKLTPKWSAVYALQAGCYSLKMAFDPKKGMSLGPKSSKTIEKALKLNNNEPTAWQQKGGSKLHTPKQFGGSIPEAIECYKKAIELYEINKLTLNNWQYLNCMVWLGQAYDKDEQYQKRFNTYKKHWNLHLIMAG